MTTFNQVHNIIETMYNSRSSIRHLYSTLPSGIIYTLESNIIKSILSCVGKHKIDVDISLPEYRIDIHCDSIELAIKAKDKIRITIENILKPFIFEHLSNNLETISYIENPNNMIMDIYTVGESIKVLL